MSAPLDGSANIAGMEVAGELGSLAAAHVPASSSRRSAGENRVARNARLIAEIAARLSKIMNFGDLAEQDLYTISQLSDYLKVSLRTLRFYEQAGLLQPHREGARRVYSADDRARLEVIVALREFEVSLTGIKQLLSTADAGGPNIETRIVALYDQLLDDVHTANATRIAELEGINGRVERARLAVSG